MSEVLVTKKDPEAFKKILSLMYKMSCLLLMYNVLKADQLESMYLVTAV